MINDQRFTEAKTIEHVRILVNDLKIGMYVAELDRPWLETAFLFQGFELKSDADIKAVREVCEFVYIDLEKQKKVKRAVSKNTPYSKGWLETRQPPTKLSSFGEEIENAGHTTHKTSSLIKNFMQEVQLGGSINVELAKQAVEACVDRVLHSPDAMLWLTQLKNRDEYTSQHSMNVCVLAISLGRQINLSIEELNHIGLCGMMHDMGKMKVPLEILNKPGKLSPKELKIMQSHTTKGWQLLMSSSAMYGGAIDVAYTHHEHLDGTGYPRQLKADQISPYARMVAIVDMYDAITSDRVYQNGRTHLEAINIMTKLSDTHLDSSLTIKFIECLGIYPPGSLVEMHNGEVAVVMEVDQKQKIRPKVIMLLDEDKNPQKKKMVDLTKINLDATGQGYRIKKIVRASDFGIDLSVLFQNGIVTKELFVDD